MVNLEVVRFNAFKYAHHIIHKKQEYTIINARKIFKKYYYLVEGYINMLGKLYDDSIFTTYQNIVTIKILGINTKIINIRNYLDILAANSNVLTFLKVKQANRILNSVAKWLDDKYKDNKYTGLRFEDYNSLNKIEKITRKILLDLTKEEK